MKLKCPYYTKEQERQCQFFVNSSTVKKLNTCAYHDDNGMCLKFENELEALSILENVPAFEDFCLQKKKTIKGLLNK